MFTQETESNLQKRSRSSSLDAGRDVPPPPRKKTKREDDAPAPQENMAFAPSREQEMVTPFSIENLQEITHSIRNEIRQRNFDENNKEAYSQLVKEILVSKGITDPEITKIVTDLVTARIENTKEAKNGGFLNETAIKFVAAGIAAGLFMYYAPHVSTKLGEHVYDYFVPPSPYWGVDTLLRDPARSHFIHKCYEIGPKCLTPVVGVISYGVFSVVNYAAKIPSKIYSTFALSSGSNNAPSVNVMPQVTLSPQPSIRPAPQQLTVTQLPAVNISPNHLFEHIICVEDGFEKIQQPLRITSGETQKDESPEAVALVEGKEPPKPKAFLIESKIGGEIDLSRLQVPSQMLPYHRLSQSQQNTERLHPKKTTRAIIPYQKNPLFDKLIEELRAQQERAEAASKKPKMRNQ